jgi:SagB-type dehydrogenase family enzyme
MRNNLEQYRRFLKDEIRQEVNFSATDQGRGVPPPPVEKPRDPDAEHVRLPKGDAWRHVNSVDLTAAIKKRRSRRQFKQAPLTLDQLAYLLWTTQGVQKVFGAGAATYRTVPSAGARHAIETYVAVLDVKDLPTAVYRYLPVEHELELVSTAAELPSRLSDAALGQSFAGQCAVTFVWTTVPYRMEWRYGLAAHKVIALDVGHVCQNLYLACQAVGAGTCAIAAYDQHAMDELVCVDGVDEFVIYLAPVGKT